MNLTSMKFKGYAWPHNPRIYSIAATRSVANHKIPGGGWYSREMGEGLRVVTGEGEFTGDNAYERFKELYSLFSEGGKGQLVHPIWRTMTAHFTALSLVQEPRADYVYYKFTFTECGMDADTSVSPVALDSASGSQSVSASLKYQVFCVNSTAAYRKLVASRSGLCRYHTMKRGQTIFTICGLYGIGYARLIELNPFMRNPHEMVAGYVVRIA